MGAKGNVVLLYHIVVAACVEMLFRLMNTF